MFKPAGDLIFVEVIKKFEGIVMPDNSKPGSGDIFKVISVGRGMVMEDGSIMPPEIEEGDTVYLAGKIIELPIEDGKILCARSGDVIAYERAGSNE